MAHLRRRRRRKIRRRRKKKEEEEKRDLCKSKMTISWPELSAIYDIAKQSQCSVSSSKIFPF